jgi:tetratricopeptide (TPR) repeat protein
MLASALWGVTVFAAPAAARGPLDGTPGSDSFEHDADRCTRLADVGACDEALRSKPDNMQLLVAKGDALLRDGRTADAILVYRRAQQLQPADERIKTKLADADSQREGLVSICQGTAGVASVDACQAALLHGAPDEFVLLKRKGILLQGMDRSDPALDAFIAAHVIRQDDKSVALAIVALTDSTGRKDALALAARGSALLTLGRPTESLKTLQQAQALAPALPGIEAQLARAKQAAREEAKHPPVSR